MNYCLQSDKTPSFLSALFAHANALLGIRHASSSARTAMSNCLAEYIVKRFSEHLKFYAKDDYSIEEVLPLMETILLATPHSKTLISPYEFVFGRPMRLGVLGDPNTAQRPTLPEISSDRIAYYKWLSAKLNCLHYAAKSVRDEVKQYDKIRYGRSHNVIEPTWRVGDCVLLQETQVKPGASKIISKQRFVGPFMIRNIVAGRPDIGQAHEMVDETTGKRLRNLVSNDRLKRYNVDKQIFNKRLLSLHKASTDIGQRPLLSPAEPKPIEIVREKIVA